MASAREGLGQRAVSLGVKRAGVRRLQLLKLEPREEYWRPKTRGDCEQVVRPCPFVSCRWNLYLDVSPSGTLKINFPDRNVDQLRETCALGVARREGVTYQEVGSLMNLTRERARQIGEAAMSKVERKRDALEPWDDAAE